MWRMSAQESLQEFVMLSRSLLSDPIAPEPFNDISFGHGVLMLPNSHDDPSGLLKGLVVAPVAGNILVQLGAPPFSIRLGGDSVLRATVPETSIHKDGNLRSGQCDVWSARKIRNVYPKPESATVKFPSQRQLRPRPSSPEARHETTYCGARCLRLSGVGGFGWHR
jgi:hypothetical protein